MASGVELGYAERTSNFTRNSTVLTDVTGLSVTVPVGARPVEISFNCPSMSNNAATGGVKVHILEDATDLGTVTGSIFSAANQACPGAGFIRRAPAAGNHTYKAQVATIISGTAQLNGGVGGAANDAPMRIQVNEL